MNDTTSVFSDLGLCVLSWKGYDTLKNSLQSYADQDFLSLFEETCVFLPEAGEKGRAIAQQFGMKQSETAENLGILGGFEAMGHSMSTPYILLLENDLPLIETREVAERQIGDALEYLKIGKAQVVRFRHRIKWGYDFAAPDKFIRYFGEPNNPTSKHISAFVRRMLRPAKAYRLSGNAIYVYKDAHKRFPKEISYDPKTDFYLVSSSILPWTNQSIMIDRQFFLDHIIRYAKGATTTRRVNGFRNLEIEMNSPYWRKSGWKVCVSPGIFTHDRQGNRGY